MKVWRTATAGAPTPMGGISVEQAKRWLNQLLKIGGIGVKLGPDVTTADQIDERMKVIVELNTNGRADEADARQEMQMANRRRQGERPKRLSHQEAVDAGRRLLGLPPKKGK